VRATTRGNPPQAWVRKRRNSRAARSGSLLANHELEGANPSPSRRGELMKTRIEKYKEKISGRILVPALLWMAGAPFALVFFLWLFFFRGK
jgi:hypothetical protein